MQVMRRIGSVVLGSFLAACGSSSSTPDAFEGPGPQDDIELVAGTPLASGSYLLIDDWAVDPNPVLAIAASDLSGPATTVFTARRVWSFGASDDGSAIMFSSFDAQEEQHFGLTIGDSIQNSFAFGTGTQRVRYLGPEGSTWQNINDECHTLSRNGDYVYVCRRYDFMQDGSFSGWRLGRIRAGDRTFEFVRAEDPTGPYELQPQELPDGKKLLFELRARPPASGANVWTRDLASGAESIALPNASRPALGPDGDRVVYLDTTAQYKLRERRLSNPGAAALVVSPTAGVGSIAWAPDGNAVVYTVFDQANSCDHIERVTWDGSAWSAPTRVRDCTQTHEFIADIAWVTVP